LYATGVGVSKDEKEAVRWYRKAAEQGYVDAQNDLGLCYLNGEGVTGDDAAVRWFRTAADQGHAAARYFLAWCYETGRGVAKDELAAASWYRKAADQGLAEGQYSLGVCYANGLPTASVLLSVCASARRNHLNPWAYLAHVLGELPRRAAGADLTELLPNECATASCQAGGDAQRQCVPPTGSVDPTAGYRP
jgi:TPR repeat protein